MTPTNLTVSAQHFNDFMQSSDAPTQLLAFTIVAIFVCAVAINYLNHNKEATAQGGDSSNLSLSTRRVSKKQPPHLPRHLITAVREAAKQISSAPSSPFSLTPTCVRPLSRVDSSPSIVASLSRLSTEPPLHTPSRHASLASIPEDSPASPATLDIECDSTALETMNLLRPDSHTSHLSVDALPTRPTINEPDEVLLASQLMNYLQNAKHSVGMYIYDLSDETIINKLNELSKRGVRVSITACTDKATNSALRDKLDSKVQLELKHPRKGYKQGHYHHKLCIIDKQYTIISSANFTHSDLTEKQGMAIVVNNEEFARRVSGSLKTTNSLSLTHETKSTVLNFLRLASSSQREYGLRPIIKNIENAKKEICIASCVVLHDKVIDKLIEASSRGIKVTLVTTHLDPKCSNTKFNEVMEQKLNKLAKSSVELHLKYYEHFHLNYMLFDSKCLILGSINLTKSSFGMNDENYVIISSKHEDQDHPIFSKVKAKHLQLTKGEG